MKNTPRVPGIKANVESGQCYKGHVKRNGYCNACKREKAKLHYNSHRQQEQDRKRLAARIKVNNQRVQNGLEPLDYASPEATDAGKRKKLRLGLTTNKKQKPTPPTSCPHENAKMVDSPLSRLMYHCRACNHLLDLSNDREFPASPNNYMERKSN